jgi:hypothetical protein
MPLRLELEVNGRLLELAIENVSPRPVRLWELHNSWGWPTLSILVRREDGGAIHTIRRAGREWTKNGPTFVALAPGGRLAVPIELGDGWWDRGEIPLGWLDGEIALRAVYHVEETPEAHSLGVLTGTARSGWVVARPPHRWLADPVRE